MRGEKFNREKDEESEHYQKNKEGETDERRICEREG